MHENTILHKLGLPTIRKTNHFEQRVNAYGEKDRWVLDRGEFQALHGFHTVREAFRVALESVNEQPDGLVLLTTKERDYVNTVLGC